MSNYKLHAMKGQIEKPTVIHVQGAGDCSLVIRALEVQAN